MTLPRIHWLASYPRSGNTWVRALLTRLLWGDAADLREMQSYVMDLHAPIAADVFGRVEPKIVKTHGRGPAPIVLEDAQGRRPFDDFETASCIYIARHPADIVCSAFDFVLLNSDFDIKARPEDERNRIFNGFVDEFITSKGDVDYPPMVATDLNAHMAGWMALGEAFPLLNLRYEDLVDDPVAELGRLAGHFGLHRSPAAREQVVADCAFAKLRRIEEAVISADDTDPDGDPRRRYSEFYKPWREAAYKRGHRFFNQGRAGRGAESLSRDQLARLRLAFAPYIARFGY